MRLLNALLAVAYAGLTIWVGLWLYLAGAIPGEDYTGEGSWTERPEAWQWDAIALLGVASVGVGLLAILVAYFAWRTGAALVALHVAVLAAAVPFAGQVPSWTYKLVLWWYAIVVGCAVAFLWTRRGASARSFGGLGTRASPSA